MDTIENISTFVYFFVLAIAFLRMCIGKGKLTKILFKTENEIIRGTLRGFLLVSGGIFAWASGDTNFSWCLYFWWPASILLIDDILSDINKDKWKKFFAVTKNKIKWLPTPLPTPATIRNTHWAR